MLSLRLQPERDGKEYMGKISHETAGIGSQRQDRKPGMRIWRNSTGPVGPGSCKMDINVGDVVRLKKQHPCGSKEWEVLRSGADFRLKCRGCGHQIMIARRLLEKNVKEIL